MPETAETSRQAPNTAFHARVRMYRHGLGDCLLVTLPRRSGDDYHILIDCGVILGTPDAANVMRRVLGDVATTTKNRIDVLVATHEHWDHVSGFVQAADIFERLEVGEVWLGWCEDPADPLARQLAGERSAALASLRLGASRMLLAGDHAGADTVASLTDFFGAARGPSTRDALTAVSAKTTAPRYCRPSDDPIDPAHTGARIYVLGPPHELETNQKDPAVQERA